MALARAVRRSGWTLAGRGGVGRPGAGGPGARRPGARRRRWAAPVLVTVLLATLLAAGPAGPAPASPASSAVAGGAAVPELRWAPCGGGFQCATAAVPLDYDRPGGPTIDLRLVRRPADDQARRIGTLFLNPGGPGGSGADFVQAADFLFKAAVLGRFDIVGFDPRGVAGSAPTSCFDRPEDLVRFLRGQPVFPVDRAEEAQYIRTYGRFADLCAENGGRILDNMSTGDVARDLDLLRQAVGDERLNFAGYSYGSIVGQTYVNMFPDKVRAVIVDGILNPIEWVGEGDEADIPFSTRVRSAEGAFEALQGFLAECDAAGPDACAFAQGGDPRSKYDELADRLRRNEIQVPRHGDDLPLGYDELVGITLGTLYSPYGWDGFAFFLQELYEAPVPDAIAAALAPVRERIAPRGQVGSGIESFAGVSCLDSNNPDNPYVWPAAAAEADRRSPYFGRLWTWAGIACAEWPFADFDDRYVGPWDADTSDTVLVIGTRFDPATRYESAQTVSDLLPDSRLLTLEGYGHTSLAQSACVDTYVANYLVRGALPPEGATCASDVEPFPGPSSAQDASRRARLPRPLPPQVVSMPVLAG